jgi:hypothetical protein
MFHVRELPAQEEEQIIDSDWKQYQTWLSSLQIIKRTQNRDLPPGM